MIQTTDCLPPRGYEENEYVSTSIIFCPSSLTLSFLFFCHPQRSRCDVVTGWGLRTFRLFTACEEPPRRTFLTSTASTDSTTRYSDLFNCYSVWLQTRSSVLVLLYTASTNIQRSATNESMAMKSSRGTSVSSNSF